MCTSDKKAHIKFWSTHQFSSLLLDCELSWHRKVSSRMAAFLLYFAFAFSLALRAAPPMRARKRRPMSPSDMGGWVVALAFFLGRLRFCTFGRPSSTSATRWCQPSQCSRLNKQESADAHPEWRLFRNFGTALERPASPRFMLW